MIQKDKRKTRSNPASCLYDLVCKLNITPQCHPFQRTLIIRISDKIIMKVGVDALVVGVVLVVETITYVYGPCRLLSCIHTHCPTADYRYQNVYAQPKLIE